MVVTGGGSALAARTNHLPSSAQWGAHRVLAPFGVPAPSVSRPRGSTSPGVGVRPSPPPAPTASVATVDPNGPEAVALCRKWTSADKNPHGKPMDPELERALSVLAGGESRVTTFCADLLTRPSDGNPSSGKPATSPATTAPATHPGKAKGKASPAGITKTTGNGKAIGHGKSHDAGHPDK
ncbi:hypothetical protein Raf01_50050 [Rugosimonospora africana]|uniref:Uncharacterized protein n=2 Tax=Rugosimonospora africana TaxID=556532 RepID=A0A8J3QU20_9ACTN|nr:hypothetical protein Raf01_50050 [Rugosimonospora africana]